MLKYARILSNVYRNYGIPQSPLHVWTKARFPLPELTARVDVWPVSITRQHGPCWRARGFH